MAEEKIAERIDANLLNVNIQEIANLPRQMFESKVANISQKTQGSLIIKEYPTATAHSGHFKALLNELALKKSFRPDIIFIDYLNICASSRYRGGGAVNSYTIVKSIAEELRGLAVEANVPIISATQTTRSGYGALMLALLILVSPLVSLLLLILCLPLFLQMRLEELGQIMVKQLKNRYNDLSVNKRFVVGIDRAKMRLYDCEQSAQENILDSGQEEEYNGEDGDKLVKKIRSTEILIMTKTIDFNNYQKFVNEVTSEASTDFVALSDRLVELDEKGANIERLMTAGIGINAEGGEFLEIVKKMVFQGKPFNEDNKEHMIIELGDLMWYVAQACMALEVPLVDVIDQNIKKLSKRYPAGTFDAYYSENRASDDR